jgi:hypothetical protein
MAQKFPIDEFDSVSAHGGRHRAKRTAKDRIFEWTRIFVAATVVAGSGYFALNLVESASVFNGEVSAPAPSATATTTDPGVTVLDASGQAGLAGKVGHLLLDAGFNVLTAANAVDFENQPVESEKTLVFINDEAVKAEATKVAAKLGKVAVEMSTDYPGPITVFLGSDYK